METKKDSLFTRVKCKYLR